MVIKEKSRLYFDAIYSPEKSEYQIFSELLVLVESDDDLDDELIDNRKNLMTWNNVRDIFHYYYGRNYSQLRDGTEGYFFCPDVTDSDSDSDC
ncbi:hypothetical protein TKK_0015415 [Trichogramma kaykai]